jgi:hypothetical protein
MQQPAAPQKPRLGQDKVVLSGTAALRRSWAQTPAVRADKVAQAKALVADSSYPPPSVTDQVAGLLAQHIQQAA